MAETKLRIAVREFSDFENALAAEIALYRETHPDVEFEAVPMDLNHLHAELFEKNGLRSGAWDIGYITTDWIAEAVEEQTLEELTPHFKQEPIPDWPEGWARSITEPVDIDGKLYTLPWHDGPECLIYRRDLFENVRHREAFKSRYGYALNPPKNWNQFTDIAHFFTRPEQKQYGTIFAAYPDGHNTLYDFALQLWSRSGELHDAENRPLLDSPEAVRALDFYRETVRDGSQCYPGAEQIDSTHSGDVFLSGSIAMMVNWFGFATRCDRSGSPLAGKVAIAPIPSDDGVPPVSLSVFWVLGIGAGSAHKQAAVDFLRFTARPEMDKGITKHGAVGVRLSTWRDAEVQRRIPVYRNLEEISLGARRLPRSRALPAVALIVNDVVTAALKTKEPSADILRRAQQRVQEQKLRF